MLTTTIAGNLGRDAELKTMANGDPLASFVVAVKTGYGEKEQTLWVDCSLFGKRASALAPYLTKGSAVTVTGEGGLRSYQNRDGQTVTVMTLRVANLALQGGRQGQSQGQASAPRAAAPKPAPATAEAYPLDDEIPF